MTGGTQKLALSPEGKYLSVAEENHVSLYEIAKRDLSAVAAVRPWPISGIALSPDGSELTCRCHLSMHAESADHELTQWMVQKGQVQPKPKSSMFVIRCFTLDQLCYRQEGGIFFQIGNTLHSLFKGISKPEHTMNDASAISVAPDGKLWVCHDINLSVFTGSSGKLAFPVWNYPMGHLINGRGGLAALATGRQWTLVSATDGSLHVFSATTGNHEPTKMLILKPPFPEVGKSLFLTADETSAFVGDNNGNITVVKIPSLEIERTQKAHTAPVNALARHQNAFFVSGSNDNSIRLWDFHGHELVTIRVHAPVRELALSPDGRTLYAVIGNDRAVTVWHLDRINELLKSQGIEIEVIP